MARKPPRLIVYLTPRASQDLQEIWDYTAATFSADHADRYLAFLEEETAELTVRHTRGKNVPNRPGLLYATFKIRPRAAGYIAFFEIVGETIEVLRYVHTSRDWHSMTRRGKI